MRNPQILLENADKNCIKEQEAEVRIKWAVPGEIFDGEANNFQNINFENTGVVFISPHIRSLYNAIRKQIPETVAVELLNLESLGDYDALLELALNIMND
jgi:cellobiose-specific phosphotransferase system component IIB